MVTVGGGGRNRLSHARGGADARESMDSLVRSRAVNIGERSRGMAVLEEAQQHYAASYQFRLDRERNKRYNYGDQWSDYIVVDGVRMTEEEYIKRQGNVPLKNNLIRRLTRNVIGVYRNQATEPTCMARDRDEQKQAETLSTLLQYNMQINHANEMNARALEEYLIGGFPVHKKRWGWMNDRLDCWTQNVQPNSFIPDSKMKDVRGWDCSFCGEIHDYSFEELCTEYAESPEDYKKLVEIYKQARDARVTGDRQAWQRFGYSDNVNMDFLLPTDYRMCRVIEVWRKESKPRMHCHDYATGGFYKVEIEDYAVTVEMENQRRLAQAAVDGIPAEDVALIESEWFMDSYWYYYFLSPFGDILKEGETPYAHKSHPYVFKAYPLIDGEIHAFVADVIDQQRYTNRLIIMQDWIMRASAKGVLMIPEDCIPEGMTADDFAEEWTKFNGVIVYKPNKSGKIPEQIAVNSTQIGIHELLNLQLKFFEDISGVNGALQGKAGYAGESGSHAQMMAQNAATSLVDLLESFNEFVIDGAYKDVKNIQQFYDKRRIEQIAGRDAAVSAQKVLTLEMDISIAQSQASQVYRARAEEFLMALFNAKAISIEQLLEVGNFPFADKLLQSIKSQREALQQGQMPEGLSPELMQQVQAGANPRAMEMLRAA